MPHHAKLPLWDNKSSEQKLESMREMLDDLYALTFADARKELLDILEKAIPWGDNEKNTIETMKQLIQKHPNIMMPNCEVGHITGSALIVDNQGRCLLHFHKKLNRWLQVGGHAEYETNVAEIAMREAKEETGLQDLKHFPNADNPFPIDFDVHTIPATDTRPEHLHLDFRYMLKTNQPEALNPPEGESKEFVWATFDDILNPPDPDEDKLLDPALYRLIAKCRERYGFRYSGNHHYDKLK